MSDIYIPQPRSKLDTVAKALGIAQSVYGIKSAMEQSQLHDLQMEQAKLNLDKSKKEANIPKGVLTKNDYARVFAPGIDGYLGNRDVKVLQDDGTIKNIPSVTIQEATAYMTAQQKAKSDSEKHNYTVTNDLKTSSEKEKNFIREKTLDFAKDNTVKEYTQNYNQAAQINALSKLNSGIADNFIKRNLFKMSGDVGAIRAEDMQQLGSDPSYLQKVKLIFTQGFEGEALTPEARKSIEEVSRVIQAKNKISLEKYANKYADILSRDSKFTKDEIISRLDPNAMLMNDAQLQEMARAISENNNSLNNTTTQQQTGLIPNQASNEAPSFFTSVKNAVTPFFNNTNKNTIKHNEDDNGFIKRYLNK